MGFGVPGSLPAVEDFLGRQDTPVGWIRDNCIEKEEVRKVIKPEMENRQDRPELTEEDHIKALLDAGYTMPKKKWKLKLGFRNPFYWKQ